MTFSRTVELRLFWLLEDKLDYLAPLERSMKLGTGPGALGFDPERRKILRRVVNSSRHGFSDVLEKPVKAADFGASKTLKNLCDAIKSAWRGSVKNAKYEAFCLGQVQTKLVEHVALLLRRSEEELDLSLDLEDLLALADDDPKAARLRLANATVKAHRRLLIGSVNPQVIAEEMPLDEPLATAAEQVTQLMLA